MSQKVDMRFSEFQEQEYAYGKGVGTKWVDSQLSKAADSEVLVLLYKPDTWKRELTRSVELGKSGCNPSVEAVNGFVQAAYGRYCDLKGSTFEQSRVLQAFIVYSGGESTYSSLISDFEKKNF